MTSTSSHSTSSHSTSGFLARSGGLGRTYRRRECQVLAATIAAADVALIGAALALESDSASGVELRLALAPGLVLVAAGLRLLLTVPRMWVFPCIPLVSASALLVVGAVGLWMWVARAAPIDALLRNAPITDLAVGFAMFLVAAVCTTMAFAFTMDAWDAREHERHWGREV